MDSTEQTPMSITILDNKLSREEWLDQKERKSNSKHTLGCAKIALKTFDAFCLSEYQKDSNQIIEELSKKNDDTVYVFLNKFVAYMDTPHLKINEKNPTKSKTVRIMPQTIKVYFSYIKSYLRSQGIRTNPDDIKQIIQFPKVRKQQREPIEFETIKTLIQKADTKREALYLLLMCSGMRIAEAMALRKADIDFKKNPALIRIRAETTKTRESRQTYMSSEAKEKIKPLLKGLDDDESIFSTNKNIKYAVVSEEQLFARLRKKHNFVKKYENGKNFHVNLHAFRAYFHTKASQKHGAEYAHALLGHGGYLPQYYRLTEAERSRKYLELEPELMLDQEQKLKLENEKEQNDTNQTVNELKQQLQMMQDKIARMEDMRASEKSEK